MGRRYLSPQLNDGLHLLTSAQILGKIFIGSVYILTSANLNTRGGGLLLGILSEKPTKPSKRQGKDPTHYWG